MRRTLTTALAFSLLALALPAAASAHHGGRHDDAHHARAHRHHRHRHAHTVVFAPSAKPSGTTTTTGTSTAPSGPVAAVASFEGGVLKITLPDGSTVSGKVTEMTEIECGCNGHDFRDGPEGFQHDRHEGFEHEDGEDNSGPGSFHHDDEQQGPQDETCGVASLLSGAKVKEAELSVSSAGAVWEKVELFPQS